VEGGKGRGNCPGGENVRIPSRRSVFLSSRIRCQRLWRTLRIIATAEENLENKVVRQNEEREPVESSRPGTSGSFAKEKEMDIDESRVEKAKK